MDLLLCGVIVSGGHLSLQTRSSKKHSEQQHPSHLGGLHVTQYLQGNLNRLLLFL